MNKIAVIKKRKEKYVYVKLLPVQAINTREAEILGSRQVYYLINPDIQIKKKSELLYKVTNYVSLKEYMQTVTTKQRFVATILSVLDMVRESQQLMLNTKNFLLNSEYIFVEPSTKRLMYIYLPIINYDVELEIKQFFQSLAYDTVFNQFEDCGYVKEYIGYFNEHPNFSIYDFEMFVRRINGESVVPGDRQVNIENTIANKMDNVTMYAHPSKLLIKDSPINGTDDREYNVIPQVQPMGTTVLGVGDSGTTVLGAAQYGTTVLSPEELNRVVYPYIKRRSSGDKIQVNKKNFTVGQGSGVDYAVTDNSAVSRNHAEIVVKSDGYYIVDKNSTNGTYIDDEKIPADVMTEIKAGQMLRFANDEYEFNI